MKANDIPKLKFKIQN